MDEVIYLDIDESGAVQKAAKANQALESIEQTAERGMVAATKAAQTQSEMVVRVVDRSRNSIERIVAQAEKKAAASGTSRLEQLAAERTQVSGRVAGDPQAIERVNAAYDRLIATEQKLQQAKGLEKMAEDARKAEAELRKSGSALSDLGGKLSTIGAALTAAITIPLGLGAIEALKLSEQFNRARTAFTGMLQSGDKANAFLSKLEQFALATPFEFKDLIPGAQRMKAFGFATSEVIPILKAVGDAAAGLGANTETMDRIALALGQIRQKGKLSAEEMRQLAEAGIPAWEILAKAIGKSIPEAMQMAEKGAISASKALPAILGGIAQRFGGQMQKQNELLSGQFSNLKDQLGFALRDVGVALTPIASQLVKFGLEAGGVIRGLVATFMSLPEPIRNATVVSLGLAAALGPVAFAAGAATKALAALYGLNAIGGLSGSVSLIKSLPAIFNDLRLAVTGGTVVLSLMETRLFMLGNAALVVGAAFGAWELGRWIRDVTGLGDVIDGLWEKMGFVTKATKEDIRAQKDQEFAAQKLYDTLKKRGIVIDRNGQSLADWSKNLKLTADQTVAFDAMLKRKDGISMDAIKKREEAEKHIAELIHTALIDEVGGLARVIARRRELLAQYGLSAKAIAGINKLTQIQFGTEQKKLHEEQVKQNAEIVKGIDDEAKRRSDADAKRFKDRQDFEQETLDIGLRALDQRYSYEQKFISETRDSRTRAIDLEESLVTGSSKRAIAQKLNLEQQKLAIETDFIAQSARVDAEALSRQYDRDIQALETRQKAGLITEQQLSDRRTALTEALTINAESLERDSNAKIAAEREKTYVRSAEIYYQSQRDAFDRTKASFESILDQMLSKTKSWGDVMKAILKSAVLQPLKDAAGTLFATATNGPRPGGSPNGGLLENLFGGVFAGKVGRPGAPGGTPGFAGPVKTLEQKALELPKPSNVIEFPKSKLEQSGHIGDVVLRSGAMPVYVINDREPVTQPRQDRSPIEWAKAAAGIGALSVALSAGIGQVKAAPSAPAQPGGVSQTIQYAGGAERVSAGPEAVFGSKLERSGHLGDVVLSAGNVPVYVVNQQPSPAPQQFAQSPSIGKLAASVGVLGGLLGGLGKLIGLGGSSSVAKAATSETVQYLGGAVQSTGPAVIQSLPSITSAASLPSTLGPGGTGGFAGPVTSTGANAATSTGIFGGAKSALSQLGGIGGAFSTAHGGFTGAVGGGLLAGGGILAFDGLRRGGLIGLGETTAGGALIGAKFGGPVGALIGGAVGALAGTIRLFVKGSEEKLKAKIKETYGISIEDKGVLRQISDTIKQSFGGNQDVGIRSPAIRDLIQLYAQATGKGFPTQFKARPVDLVQSGGTLSQAASSYENGRGVGYGSSLPQYGGGFSVAPTSQNYPGGVVTVSGSSAVDRIASSAAPQSAGSGEVAALSASVKTLAAHVQRLADGGVNVSASIQMDPKTTTSFVQGQQVKAIASNSRVVGGAVAKEVTSNRNRRVLDAALRSPSTLIA